MKNVNAKSFFTVKALLFILMGTWISACENNEGIAELERTTPRQLPPDNGLEFRERPCADSDPAITAIHIDYSTFPNHVLSPDDPSPKFNFTMDFINLGSTPWSITPPTTGFQCYRSKDAILSEDDLKAGGAAFSKEGDYEFTLGLMDTHTDDWRNTIFIPDYAQYPYLIVKVNYHESSRTIDCNTSNNVLVQRIEFPILDGNL